MSGLIATLALNIAIVILLTVTIAYCWMLNRRIRVLQDSKGELAQFLKHFDDATQRASDSVAALQTNARRVGETIQLRVDKATYVADDLTFLIDKASKLADQLEADLAISRARKRALGEAPESPVAEPELRAATRDIQEKPSAETAPAETAGVRARASASLEAMLERVLGQTRREEPAARVAPPVTAATKPEVKPRSKVEQELLEMLRTGVKG